MLVVCAQCVAQTETVIKGQDEKRGVDGGLETQEMIQMDWTCSVAAMHRNAVHLQALCLFDVHCEPLRDGRSRRRKH